MFDVFAQFFPAFNLTAAVNLFAKAMVIKQVVHIIRHAEFFNIRGRRI